MNVNREQVLRVLRLLKSGLAKKEAVEQTRSYLFKDGRIITYNDEISVSAPFPLDLHGAVSAPDLYEFFERSTASTVDITFDNQRLYLKSGNLETSLLKDSEILLPLENIEYPDETEWMSLPKDFKEKLRQCVAVTSNNYSKPALCCVHWHSNFLEATDNYRIIRCTIDAYLPDELKVLINRNSTAELIKYNPVAFAFSKGWAHFKIGDGAIFSARVSDKMFPDVGPALSGEFLPIPFPASRLADILGRSIQYAQEDSIGEPRVTISIADNYLSVTTATEEGAQFKETCKIAFQGPRSFYVNPKTLKEVLKMKFDRIGISSEGAVYIRFEKRDVTYLMVYGVA